MNAHAFSLRLGFSHSLTATWLMRLGIQPRRVTEAEYQWDEDQLEPARLAIEARMRAALNTREVSEGRTK